ncbi:MAG: PHP domain-containing protein [bacterium]
MTVSAVFHIHTIFSDGRANREPLLAAARSTGASIVAIVDHDTVENRTWMGWQKNCFILAGTEVTLKGDQHAVAFGLDKAPTPRVESAATLLNGLPRRAFTYIAHPYDQPCPVFGLRGYPFTEWKHQDRFHGIEVWNLVSTAKGYARSFLRGAQLFKNTVLLLPYPTREVLQKWDEIAATHRYFGICGLDEHTYPIHKYWFNEEVFGLEKSFGIMRNHLLLDESVLRTSAAEDEILKCLREGRFYFAFDGREPADGFDFRVRTADGEFPMGAEIPFNPPVQLRFKLPRKAGMKIFCNGVMAAFHSGEEFFVPADKPGCYRAEVYYRARPWIFSNPIWLLPPPTAK